MALPWEKDPIVTDTIPEPFRPTQQAMGRANQAPANDAPWMADDIVSPEGDASQPYNLRYGGPLDPAGEGDIGFASPASNEANSLPPGAQEFQRDLQHLLGQGVFDSPDALKRYSIARGFEISDEQAQAAFDATQSGQGVVVSTPTYREPDISDVRPGVGEDPRRALLRGVPAVVGLDDEAGAIVDMLMRGGTWEENLARNRAIRDYDEENHAIARTAGTIAGGALLPSGAASSARSAAVEALRAGLGREAAISAARGDLARTMAAEGAGYGAAYGAGAADGNALDRGVGALAGGIVGGASAPVLGVAGSKLLGPGAASAAERNAPTEGQQVAQAAERLGIDVLPADVAGPTTRRLTGAAAQAPLSAAPVIKAAQRSTEQAQEARDRIAARFGEALNPEAAGEAARRGAGSYIETSRVAASRLYDKAAELAGDARVNPAKARAVLDEQIARLEQVPGGGDGLEEARALRANLDGDFTVQGIRDMRTERSVPVELRGGPAERRLRQVVDAAAQDVVDSLRAQGRQQAADAFAVADRRWKERIQNIDRVLAPIIGKDGERSGEQVTKAIMADLRGNNARAAKFLNALPDEEKAIMRASVIGQMGRASKGQQNAEGDAFSLSTFLTNWNDIGESAKAAWFGPEGRKALNDLAKVAEGTKEAQKYANSSNTAGGIWGNLGVLGGIAAADPTTAAAGGAAQLIGGRLLASPKFARWLARAPRKPNAAAQRAHISALSQIAKSEPAIASDVIELQRVLQQAITRSPASSAAAEQNQDVGREPPEQERPQ